MAVLGNRSLAYEPFVQDDTVSLIRRITLTTVATIQTWTLALEKRGNPLVCVRR
jgi:hypothetical protein